MKSIFQVSNPQKNTLATEEEITNSYNNGPDWQGGETSIFDLDQDPNQLYCIFDEGYFIAIANFEGLKEWYVDLSKNDIEFIWAVSLQKNEE